jgi:hypothetical protein
MGDWHVLPNYDACWYYGLGVIYRFVAILGYLLAVRC